MLSMDSESSARLLLFGAVGLVVLLAAAFIGFGYWYAEVRPEGRSVLKADGINVTYASMKRRMEFELFLNPQFAQAPQVLPEAAYQNLLNELTLISRAESELGITANEQEIDARLRQRIGVAPDADQRTFADRFRDALRTSGLTESEYRRLSHAEVLSQKIRDQFTAQAPATAEQAQVEIISVADAEAAEAARARVVAGEEWAVVAREVSSEPDVAETGGLQDYAPDGGISLAYNDFAFEAAVGDISDPLSQLPGQGPFHIVRLIDRSDQPLTEDQKPAFVSRQYSQWLEDTQAKMTIERHWEPTDQAEALSEIDSAPRQAPAIVPTVSLGTPAAAPTTAAVPTVPAAAPADSDTAPEAPDPSGAPQPNGQ